MALGAAIAAGVDGVKRNLELGDGVAVDPGYLSESERSARGIDLLPTNLGDAIANFSRDDILLSALGSDLANAYLAVRKAEWEAMKNMQLQDEVNLLLERY